MNKPDFINYKPKKEFNFYEFIFIGIIFFIIFIYVLLFIFYPYISVIEDNNKIKKINDTGCLINQCKMNRNSGEKICPVPGSRIDNFNIELEVCMDKDNCPSQQYILKDNGESNVFPCPDNKICNCTQDIRCGREIGSVFNVIKGNYYKVVDNNSRYKDKDIIFRTDHSYKSFFESDLQILYHSPPISIKDPLTQLCSVTQKDYKYINPLVCSRGILSLYKENPTDDISLFLVTCINEPLQIGPNCDVTTNIPVFDKTTMKFIGGVNISKDTNTGENKIGNNINNNICLSS